jgi:uncharacterized protein YxjI
MIDNLKSVSRLFVKQSFEIAEIFSFETRNKYRILSETGHDIAFAAEQQKGFLGILLRQFLGHWRKFDIHFFTPDRREFMIAEHPFRWFFQRLELREVTGRPIGMIERRFSIFTKSFEVRDSQQRVVLEVSSPIWRLWTFPFRRHGRDVARIAKKWSGIGYEVFTDKDNFLVEYLDPALSTDERALVLAAAIYIDLMFFENKGSGGVVDLIGN